jgi:hypothetical protein
MSRYNDFDCEDRKEYLEMLAEDYNVPFFIVVEVARLLGEEEDFDGLPSTLADYS